MYICSSILSCIISLQCVMFRLYHFSFLCSTKGAGVIFLLTATWLDLIGTPNDTGAATNLRTSGAPRVWRWHWAARPGSDCTWRCPSRWRRTDRVSRARFSRRTTATSVSAARPACARCSRACLTLFTANLHGVYTVQPVVQQAVYKHSPLYNRLDELRKWRLSGPARTLLTSLGWRAARRICGQ